MRTDRRTDKHDKAKSRFSQFRKRAWERNQKPYKNTDDKRSLHSECLHPFMEVGTVTRSLRTMWVNHVMNSTFGCTSACLETDVKKIKFPLQYLNSKLERMKNSMS
jgi:hypothetical protein